MAKPEEHTVELPEEYTGSMSIMYTQCCGLHSVHGFQYHRNGKAYALKDVQRRQNRLPNIPVTLKAFVKAIQAGYKAQRDQNTVVRQENEKALDAGDCQYPNPNYVPKPEKRASLMLFTWNNKTWYQPGAERLAKQIADAGLGSCTISDYARNPNSGANVAAMVWAVDVVAYDKYVKEHGL